MSSIWITLLNILSSHVSPSNSEVKSRSIHIPGNCIIEKSKQKQEERKIPSIIKNKK